MAPRSAHKWSCDVLDMIPLLSRRPDIWMLPLSVHPDLAALTPAILGEYPSGLWRNHSFCEAELKNEEIRTGEIRWNLRSMFLLRSRSRFRSWD